MNNYSFRKLFLAYTFCCAPFMLLAGILTIFDVIPVYFNEKPYTGITGFFISVLLIPVTGFMLSIFNWLALNFGTQVFKAINRLFRRSN